MTIGNRVAVFRRFTGDARFATTGTLVGRAARPDPFGFKSVPFALVHQFRPNLLVDCLIDLPVERAELTMTVLEEARH